MPAPHLVAIVGRPNVGKSTLFNRIIQRRQAVVDDRPGITRDRIYAHADWAGVPFRLVDTGGLVPDSKDPMEVAVRIQAEVAMAEAAVIVFVTDIETGPTDLDLAVAGLLRRSGRPVIVAANKADNADRAMEVHAFHSLGLGDPVPVSAISGRGSGDLLDAIMGALPPPAGQEEGEASEAVDLRIAVLGRPNVGKSSFVNAVCGTERVIVAKEAGTTRDPADTELEWEGKRLALVDTAGLRRRSQVTEGVEYYSALRALQSLDRCDSAMLMIDAVEGASRQEARLLERILDRGKAAVILVNKWDLVEKETDTAQEYERGLREGLPFAYYVPVLFISALSGQRVDRALSAAVEAGEARRRTVRTAVFNRFVDETLRGPGSPTPAMGDLRVSYALQAGVEPPTFLFFVNDPEKVKPNFRRYLERQIRQSFNLDGTPVRLRFRPKA